MRLHRDFNSRPFSVLLNSTYLCSSFLTNTLHEITYASSNGLGKLNENAENCTHTSEAVDERDVSLTTRLAPALMRRLPRCGDIATSFHNINKVNPKLVARAMTTHAAAANQVERMTL